VVPHTFHAGIVVPVLKDKKGMLLILIITGQ